VRQQQQQQQQLQGGACGHAPQNHIKYLSTLTLVALLDVTAQTFDRASVDSSLLTVARVSPIRNAFYIWGRLSERRG
jgi:hypothetical protein